MRLALATAIAAWEHDIDMPPLLAACRRQAVHAEVLAWDDPSVSWSRFDAVLLRSTWDYTQRLREFLDWCTRVDEVSTLINPLDTLRWNADKHYLLDLAARGVPIVPSRIFEPGQEWDATHAFNRACVVKPCVGAGSRDAARFAADQAEGAEAHARKLLAQGRSVLVQPYLAGVDRHGETALIHIQGRYSHAIRKGPLLRLGDEASQELFAEEDIQPRIATDAEHEVAQQALEALPEAPLYARVDLLPSAEGPRVLELELVEPSLFFEHSEDAADRLILGIADLLYRPTH